MPWPIEMQGAFSSFVLSVGRALPVVWMVPVFGGPILPAQIRMALGLGLGCLCLPLVAVAPFPIGSIRWAMLLFREVLVGTVMGFVIACLFRAIEAAGLLTDSLRGANVADARSSLASGEGSPLGSLFLLLATVAFWKMGGAAYVAKALAGSYQALPLAPATRGVYTQNALVLVLAASAKLFEAALALAAPVVVSLLIADLIIGVLGRVVPGVPLAFVGMPAKALLGVGMVLVGIGSVDALLTLGLHGIWAVFEKTGFVVP
jgi:type III secretory pathway component EscT